MSTDFSEIDLSQAQLKNLERLGYKAMTPIQEKSLPIVLNGEDLIAKAKTGSGKTAAFAIGILEKLNPRFFGIQVLVLCPTRELSTQVTKEFRRLAQYQANIKILTLCGGQSIGPQIGSLEHGAHIVVGTPGRIMDHLKKNTLNLEQLSSVVLDEADRMLDMGFYEDIKTILETTPKQRQTLLFSATYPQEITALSQQFQINPKQISVDIEHHKDQITQVFFNTEKTAKTKILNQALLHYQPTTCLIFCNMKITANQLYQELLQLNHTAMVLHGDLEQRDRDLALLQFNNMSCPILIATDVAARGIDISNLSMVVNYDLPIDFEVYIHRIGRTGRAGNIGQVLNLVTSKDDRKLADITYEYKNEIEFTKINDLTCNNTKPSTPTMKTLCIGAGRKDKIRPGDILGALTGDAGIDGKYVGKIDILNQQSFVAIEHAQAQQALERLNHGKIKGRKIRVRYL